MQYLRVKKKNIFKKKKSHRVCNLRRKKKTKLHNLAFDDFKDKIWDYLERYINKDK